MTVGKEYKNRYYNVYGFFFCIALIFLDQATKYAAAIKLKGQEDIVLIKDILVLHYLYPENRGIAFGLFQGSTWFFAVLTVLVLIILIWIYMRIPKKRKYTPLIVLFFLVTAGAIGNFIDRVFRGFVIDFIYFKAIDFPIFNFADIYITSGEILLIIFVCLKYKDEDFSFLRKEGK